MSHKTTTRFGLIRHAKTQWNREKRIQGQADSALTEEGLTAAGRWAMVLSQRHWDRILVSDIGRAVKTAERINGTLGRPIEREVRLREQDWGKWTGMAQSEVAALFPRMPPDRAGVGWEFCPPGGESRLQVRQRSEAALVAAAGKWSGETILVVTHEGVIRCLLKHCLGHRFRRSEPRIWRSGHLHLLACHEGRLSIEAINAVDLNGGASAPGPDKSRKGKPR